MNDTFEASNGIELRVTGNGWLERRNCRELGTRTWDEVCGINTKSPALVWDALREFFQHERDQELGRWRWPENPDVVVQADKGGERAWVVNERNQQINGWVWRVDLDCSEAHAQVVAAARAYFDAHHEPKPWHDAKQNELWELRIEHCYESEVYRFAQDTTCADSGVFRPVNNPKRVFFDPKSPRIETGRRIWPEVSDA